MVLLFVLCVLGLGAAGGTVGAVRRRVALRAWDAELAVAFARDDASDPLVHASLRGPRRSL